MTELSWLAGLACRSRLVGSGLRLAAVLGFCRTAFLPVVLPNLDRPGRERYRPGLHSGAHRLHNRLTDAVWYWRTRSPLSPADGKYSDLLRTQGRAWPTISFL